MQKENILVTKEEAIFKYGKVFKHLSKEIAKREKYAYLWELTPEERLLDAIFDDRSSVYISFKELCQYKLQKYVLHQEIVRILAIKDQKVKLDLNTYFYRVFVETCNKPEEELKVIKTDIENVENKIIALSKVASNSKNGTKRMLLNEISFLTYERDLLLELKSYYYYWQFGDSIFEIKDEK